MGTGEETAFALPALAFVPRLQIAQLAAEGLSNREIGQRLYLSHRTRGTHLYRTFPKLGITARGELSAALSAATTPLGR